MDRVAYFLAGVSTSLFTAVVTPKVDTQELAQLRSSLRSVQDTIASHDCFVPVAERNGWPWLWCFVLAVVAFVGWWAFSRRCQARFAIGSSGSTPIRSKGPTSAPLGKFKQ